MTDREIEEYLALRERRTRAAFARGYLGRTVVIEGGPTPPLREQLEELNELAWELPVPVVVTADPRVAADVRRCWALLRDVLSPPPDTN
jgi:hypothetical protein